MKGKRTKDKRTFDISKSRQYQKCRKMKQSQEYLKYRIFTFIHYTIGYKNKWTGSGSKYQ